MRKDVKIGIVLAVVVAVSACGYFLGREDAGQAIPLTLDEPPQQALESQKPLVKTEIQPEPEEVGSEPARSEPVWLGQAEPQVELFRTPDEPVTEDEDSLDRGEGLLADSSQGDEPEVAEPKATSDDWRPVSLTAMRDADVAKPALVGKVDARAGAVETYRIQKGDTLSRLAEIYYGSQRYYGFLLKANPQITNPNRMAIGTVVTLPPLPASERTPANTTSAKERSRKDDKESSQRTYVVQEDETLWGIAARLLGSGNRWEEILELNRDVIHASPEGIQPGLVLKLPPRTEAPKNKP